MNFNSNLKNNGQLSEVVNYYEKEEQYDMVLEHELFLKIGMSVSVSESVSVSACTRTRTRTHAHM